MKAISRKLLGGLSALAIIALQPAFPVRAQAPAPAAAPTQTGAEQPAATLLSEDDLEVLVARIALYPDELVAAISAASLFPLQIIEAQRFLEAKKKNSDLKPKSDWDGSVVSLLNYPDIIKMMSEDLDWTQSLADALANQQKDVLIAIQQLRDEAVAKNIIKTDDKVTVVTENDNVIIRPTDPEKIYIPQYPPEMLYEPDYAAAPISYYPDYYDSYYYPGAAFFAGAVTGLAWAAVVNWDDWGVWGGRWDGDIDIDCNNCLNDRNFNGKMKWNDVDWANVDRSKLSIGKDQLAKLDRSAIKSGLQADNRNQLRNKAADMQAGQRPGNRGTAARAEDIRKNTAQGLKAKPQANRPTAANRQNVSRPETRSQNSANRPSAKPAQKSVKKPSKPQMAARPDNRGRQSSALGNVQSGRQQTVASKRGAQSMGAHRPAARPVQHSRPMPSRGGGGGRGGGGRGGGGRR
ncbi:hypothetical protein GGE16_001963 [Rhizobium leguminosarum]|uniref:DUF3300 domain-containing protein n=1 Tax=Rhizobium leguminosarum TaxID=384 RepID=A0AAE2MI51_RHILE|nr:MULTISPECIES: DUF3300 domain-containing protein [Rhizobium]MBB4289923.1 hypothetical protein [Rhizobium leguminosarum]MBB4296567.1 hypothetical protein [Rhizobium leguminosarum]MBB4308173.1 hypothetical protein [Rhizobium leguminosarum]MBB4416008.1 hypothetical protein [Rhizobium leguminosarum]MBB4431025.1 hypothetical protein [Rhizobium esperanzae]